LRRQRVFRVGAIHRRKDIEYLLLALGRSRRDLVDTDAPYAPSGEPSESQHLGYREWKCLRHLRCGRAPQWPAGRARDREVGRLRQDLRAVDPGDDVYSL